MASLHNRPDAVPALRGLPLTNPHKKECQITEKHMRFDPFVLAMIERTKLKATSSEESVSSEVERRYLPSSASSCLSSAQLILRRPLLLCLINRPMVLGFSRLISQSPDHFFDPLESPLSCGLVLFGLLGVKDKNEPPAPFSLAHSDLLDLQVIFDFLEAALEGERFLMGLLAVPKFLSQDGMPSGSLEEAAVSLGVHRPVHDPDQVGKLPAQKVRLYPLHCRHLLGRARKNPTAPRKPFLGHGQANDHLGSIRPFVLPVSVLASSLFLLTFRISGRRVKEEKVNLQVKKIGCGEKNFSLDHLFGLQEKIHRPLKMLQRDGLGVAQGHIFSYPFLNPSLGIRRQSARSK